MIQPPSALPTDPATQAKRNFVVAAHQASPLRAVERYPWTAVTATAAATMAATVVISLPVFGKAVGKTGRGIFTTGLGLLGPLLQAKFGQPPVKVNAPPASPPPPGAVG